MTATFEKLGKEVAEWENLSAMLNTNTKKKRKRKVDIVDGSTATEAIELNIHQDNLDDTFNPFGE